MNNVLLSIATREVGVAEIPGRWNNPLIIGYAHACGGDWVKDDETNWCGFFMGYVFSELPSPWRKPYPEDKSGLAREWLKYGKAVELADAGDVAVFWRKDPASWKGHVGFYIAETKDEILTLGGNQKGRVCFAWQDKRKLLGFRRF